MEKVDLYENEVIMGGAFKSGLCYIKNYDGSFLNDYRNPREAMEPDGVINEDDLHGWPDMTHAILFHNDGTVDLCVLHDVKHECYLRQSAWELYMYKVDLTHMPREKWISWPQMRLLCTNSPMFYEKDMIEHMLKFGGIDINQFSICETENKDV